MKKPREVALFDVPILNVTMAQALERITDAIRARKRSCMYFVNADCLNKTFKDAAYLDALKQADAVFGDGIGVYIASVVAGTPIVDNVNGTDMLPLLCRLCAKEGFSLFLLGAKPGVAERMQGKLCEKYEGLKIIGCHHGHFNRELETRDVIAGVNGSGADILLVAFGAPIQEKWIHDHATEIGCPVVMGVGGLFDFYSGDKPRAPLWMRRLGIEWAHRLFYDPKRLWQRYILGNPLFLWRVLGGRVTGTL